MPTNNLKRMRESAGLSMAELADRAGLTSGAIAHVETGRSHGRPETRWALVRALNLPYLAVFPIELEDAGRSETDGVAA